MNTYIISGQIRIRLTKSNNHWKCHHTSLIKYTMTDVLNTLEHVIGGTVCIGSVNFTGPAYCKR